MIGGFAGNRKRETQGMFPCRPSLITLSSLSLRALISVSLLETSRIIMLHERRSHCHASGLFVKRKVLHFPFVIEDSAKLSNDDPSGQSTMRHAVRPF